MNLKKIFVYCKDESEVEEFLKWLYRREIRFQVIGRQAFIIYIDRIAVDWLSKSKIGFNIRKVKNLAGFPKSCWVFAGARKKSKIPDKFIPVAIKPQRKL